MTGPMRATKIEIVVLSILAAVVGIIAAAIYTRQGKSWTPQKQGRC